MAGINSGWGSRKSTLYSDPVRSDASSRGRATQMQKLRDKVFKNLTKFLGRAPTDAEFYEAMRK